MQKFLTSISTLLLTLPALTIHAETIRYNIEIVIFEDSSNHYLDSEQWPIIHQTEIELTSDTLPPGLEALPEDDPVIDGYGMGIKPKKAEYPEINSVIDITHNENNALAEHVTKLERSSRYNVLLHQSWQQAGLNDTDAVNIIVDTNEIENKNLEVFSTSLKQIEIDKKLKSSIQGSIKLVLGRYLHIHSDLHYKRINKLYRPDSPVLNNKKFEEFSIKSQRKMRSNELHYIDHPLLGILAIVSPIKIPEPVEENKKLDDGASPEIKPASNITTHKNL